MKKSKRHHYIPKFFINGFTSEDGKLSVFDKTKGKIDKIRKSPKQLFFEWNRNSFNVNGSETDFLENVYQLAETKFADVYYKLTEKFEPTEITAYDILHLTLFISEIHWRIPSRDKNFNQNISNFDFENAPFNLRHKKTGEKLPLSQLKKLTEEPAFTESLKPILAIQDYIRNSKKINVEDWLIYYLPKEAPQLKLLCDNPIISRNDSRDVLESELVFNLSKSKTVYHTKGNRLKEIPPINSISIDVLLYLQAQRFVCCSDESYLNSIIELSKLYNTPEKILYLKNEIFEVFE